MARGRAAAPPGGPPRESARPPRRAPRARPPPPPPPPRPQKGLLGPASPKRVASFDSRGAYLALGEVVVSGLRGSRPHRQVAG